MAITKRQISELLINIKSGGETSSESKFDEREIWVITEMVVNNLIAQYFAATKEILGGFLLPFEDVPIEFNEKRNEYFSKLPARQLLIDGDGGIQQVSPMEDQQLVYIKRKHGALSTYRNLEAGNLLGRTSYYPEGDKIFYVALPKIMQKDGTVLIKQIASVESIDPDSALPIPSMSEIALFNTVSTILEQERQIPQDRNNDSSPNTTR